MQDDSYILINKHTFQVLLCKIEFLHQKLDEINDSTPNKEWLSEKDAAAYLSVSTRRLRQIRSDGKIGYSQERPGTAVYYKSQELKTYLNRNYNKKHGQ